MKNEGIEALVAALLGELEGMPRVRDRLPFVVSYLLVLLRAALDPPITIDRSCRRPRRRPGRCPAY